MITTPARPGKPAGRGAPGGGACYRRARPRRRTPATMLWLKAFHIIFMVTWFAGLFYLPRLFVYHAQLENDEAGHARFCTMERKLFWGITTPGGVLTVATGLALVAGYGSLATDWGWLHVKLALVALLIAYHVWCGVLVRAFAQGANRHDHVWYRWFNEVPTVLLIGIVILAVVRPF